MQHLNLEESLRLEELGFPLTSHFYRLTGEPDRIIDQSVMNGKTFSDMNRPVACPTLSELIDWLGEEFDSLERYHHGHPEIWYATGNHLHTENYATPLEAIYALATAIKTNN